MAPIVTKLITGLKGQDKRHRFDAYPLMYEIALNQPTQIAPLLRVVIDESPAGGTFFNDAISFLPLAEFPGLVEHALEALGRRSQNAAAELLIAQCGLQCPKALHPHLDAILSLRVNEDSYFRTWPWRESGHSQLAALRSVLLSSSNSKDDRDWALEAMLETRDPKTMRFAIEARLPEKEATMDDAIREAGRDDLAKALVELKDLLSNEECASEDTPESDRAAWHLLQVGYEMNEGRLRRLYPERAWHLIFAPDYFHTEKLPLHLKQHHPTWGFKTRSGPGLRFGGEGSEMCAVCGSRSHHLLTLGPVPAGLGVSGLKRLSLEVCLSCLGWEASPLFYRHNKAGAPKPFAFKGKRVKPRFPAAALAGATARLAATPKRWLWQDWALSNSRQNLHRVGGHPCWIQNPDYLGCPECEGTMRFLIQLDSDLPTASGGEFLWGSGGICYGFWCDHCKISGFHWQCT